jgi:hypothetical protein
MSKATRAVKKSTKAVPNRVRGSFPRSMRCRIQAKMIDFRRKTRATWKSVASFAVGSSIQPEARRSGIEAPIYDWRPQRFFQPVRMLSGDSFQSIISPLM